VIVVSSPHFAFHEIVVRNKGAGVTKPGVTQANHMQECYIGKFFSQPKVLAAIISPSASPIEG
jgi:hypothetical protein